MIFYQWGAPLTGTAPISSHLAGPDDKSARQVLAYPTLRMDLMRSSPARLAAQLSAKLVDVNVNAAVRRRQSPSQNNTGYLVSCNHSACHSQQQFEKVELKSCEFDIEPARFTPAY